MQQITRLLRWIYIVGLVVIWAADILLVILGHPPTATEILHDVVLTVVLLVFGVAQADSQAKPEQKP